MAEQALVNEADGGSFDNLIADPSAPEDDPRRSVRADVLRLLILGAPDAPRVHEKGVRVRGAVIHGNLDLEGCRIDRDIGLVDCVFKGGLILRSATIDTLFLDGSRLPAINAERLHARGDVLLRQTVVDGPVLLPGARIGGSLVADGAQIMRLGERALDATNADVRGDVSLIGAAIRGRIALAGARLAADLDATGATLHNPGAVALGAEGASIRGDVLLRHSVLSGELRLNGARCEAGLDLSAGTFSAPGADACNLRGATLRGTFAMKEGARIDGLLDLSGATVGAIVDDPASWPGAGDLALNRCLYGAFLAAPADAAIRLRWLALQAPGRWQEDFWPQPYEHLAAVLTDMGHNEDAARVLFEKERLQRRARRRRARTWLGSAALWLRDLFLRFTVGYGRRSLMVLVWLALLWIGGSAALIFAWEADAMRPNMPFILRLPEWVQCAVETDAQIYIPSLAEHRPGLAAAGQSQLDCYLAQPEAAAYPAFNPYMFAIDAILPAVETGQRGFWSPDTRMPVGQVAKGVDYGLTISGWVLGLLAVAALSGLVRSR
jgi:hypothetical protein